MLSRLCLILAFIFLPFMADAEVFNPKTMTLPNGMRVVVIENHRAPAVAHMVWYDVGAANEEAGKSGLAHFFEHLMFKGTDKTPAGEFSKMVKRLGGNDNAFTSQDYTAYFQQVPKQHLETVMMMEADRMVNLNTSDENILTERDVIIEERKERTDNNPASILREEVNSALFANHPYGVPVIGWMNEIENLSPQDTREFYKRWYAPNNAILIVSGDITMNELKPLAEKYYGVLEPVALPKISYPEPAPIKTDHRIFLTDPRVGTPTLQYNYRAPKNSEALQVWAEAFGGHTTSPLYKELVVDQKQAVQAGVYYNSVSESHSALTFYIVPAPGVEIGDAEKAFEVILKKYIETPLPAEDISRAKQRLMDAAIFERDSLMGPAMIIGRALTSGYTIDDVENWPDDVAAITVEQAHDAAVSIMNGYDKPVISYLLPPEPEAEGEE